MYGVVALGSAVPRRTQLVALPGISPRDLTPRSLLELVLVNLLYFIVLLHFLLLLEDYPGAAEF